MAWDTGAAKSKAKEDAVPKSKRDASSKTKAGGASPKKKRKIDQVAEQDVVTKEEGLVKGEVLENDEVR